MFMFNRRPFFEQDGGPAGPADFGTPPELNPEGPAPGEPGGQPQEPVQSTFAQYMGLDLSSIPEEQRPAMIERLKQVDSAFTPAMQKFKPWTQLEEQGITPDQVQTALQLERAIKENPEILAQLLQSAMPAPPQVQQPQQEADPLAPLAESYGEEVAGPIRRVLEVAQRAEQRADKLEQLLKDREARDEKDTFNRAAAQAEAGLKDWLGKNPHFKIQADQLRDELARTAGKQGVLAGFAAKDYDAAALRVLGPEKYGDAVYAKRLETERAKVDETAPGPVVKPGSATTTMPKDGPGFESPREMLGGALEYAEALRRQYGG